MTLVSRALAASVFALALVGCVTPGDGGLVETAAAPRAEPAPPPTIAPKPAAKPQPAPRTALVRPRFTTADLDPDRLLHLRRGQISTILGQPGFVRREAAARVWQYRTRACVLDLFLYDEAAVYRVVHYEFRATGDNAVSIADCFETLLLRRTETATS